MPLTLLQLEHKSKTEPFLEGKDLTIHHGARFHFCGCCFQKTWHGKAGRTNCPQQVCSSRHLGIPAAAARAGIQSGCPSMDGSKYWGLSGLPTQAKGHPEPPRGQGVLRALCPRAVRGCRGGEAALSSKRGHPGSSSSALHQLGRGELDILWFGVFFCLVVSFCFELNKAPPGLKGPAQAPGRVCAGCSSPLL